MDDMPLSSTHYSNEYFQKFKTSSNIFKNLLLSWVDRKGPVLPYLKKQLPPKSKLLDFACGDGLFLSYAQEYFDCTGVDFSVEALKRAKKKAVKSKLIRGDIPTLKTIKKQSLSAITCFDMLEHTVNQGELLDRFYDCLQDDGKLVISVPISDSVSMKWEQDNCWMLDDNSHVRILSRSSWLRLLEDHGFVVVKLLSSGLINHPTKKLSFKTLTLHWLTQPIGLMGLWLPALLSDVDFMVAIKNPHFRN